MCSVVGSVVFVVSQPGCLQLVVEVSGCQLSAFAVDAQTVVSIQLLLASLVLPSASPASAAAPALCDLPGVAAFLVLPSASPVSAAVPDLPGVAVSVVEAALPSVCNFLGSPASCVELVMTVLQTCYISPATLPQFQMFFSESSFSECSSELG